MADNANENNVSTLSAITEINLDVNQPVLCVVPAKQYDTARQVKAHLFYSGVRWYVPKSNVVSVVSYKKADKIGGFYDTTEDGRTAISIDTDDESLVYILLDRQTLTTAGNCSVEVTFYDSITLGRLSTFSFILRVEPATITELDLSSNPYFNVLAKEIAAAMKAAETVDTIRGLTATAVRVDPDTADITPERSGGPDEKVPYNFEFKIPSFPGIEIDDTVSKLAPGATPTVESSGGTAEEKYTLSFGIPTFPGIEIDSTVSKLAPGATPTVASSGGTATTKYKLAFGIPTFPGIDSTPTVNTLPAGSTATASVSGGGSGTTKYSFTFGIPKGDKGDPPSPTTTNYQYATSTSGTTIPATGWGDSVAPIHGQYYWTKAVITWDNGGTSTIYSVSYIGNDGGGSTASDIIASDHRTVQAHLDEMPLTASATNVKVYTNNWSLYSPIDSQIGETYTYRAAVTVSGATTDMFPQVAFSVEQAESGNFAPVAKCGAGVVYIYASSVPDPEESNYITIPSIICIS